jgi:NAD(P)-dependent dehydrogenase (short-subunit alcohol dehydrogenase family)
VTRILITGANRGIGAALAEAALTRGWQVIGTSRDGSAIEGVQPLMLEVNDPKSIQKAAAAVEGPIDILVNNAGIIGPDNGPAGMVSDADAFMETISVNTLGPALISQAFLPHLRKAEAGRIVTISSQMSFMGYRHADRIAYRASKSAVNKVMQGFATMLEPEGISVALIDPGWVRTDMGGEEADNSSYDVANGVLNIAERMNTEHTGTFFKWTGEPRSF